MGRSAVCFDQQMTMRENIPPYVEFWSSVEYGTFLKGLVREFLRDAKTEAAVPPRSERPETRNSKPETACGGARGIENRLGPATVLP